MGRHQTVATDWNLNLFDAAVLEMDGAFVSPGYTALRQRAAWIDLSARGKIRVAGEDRARLLHAMTTNQVQKLHPGQGCYAFFLNAQGRILADVNILCFEDHLLLDTEPETRHKIFEHLERYIIADDVTLTDETERLTTISVEGPDAEIMLEHMDLPTPAEPYTTSRWKDRISARIDTTGAGGYFIIAGVESKPELVTQLTAHGIPEALPDEARTVRIERGRPRYGEEITERYLVQETGQMHAVNFTKGCYLGQEIVERVRSRAQIHRILKRVEIDTKQPPEPGTKLQSADGDAGEVVSSVYSPTRDKVVAMAYVKPAFAEPGSEMKLGDAVARVR